MTQLRHQELAVLYQNWIASERDWNCGEAIHITGLPDMECPYDWGIVFSLVICSVASDVAVQPRLCSWETKSIVSRVEATGQTLFVWFLKQHDKNCHMWANQLRENARFVLPCAAIETLRSGLTEMRHWCCSHILEIQTVKAAVILNY